MNWIILLEHASNSGTEQSSRSTKTGKSDGTSRSCRLPTGYNGLPRVDGTLTSGKQVKFKDNNNK
jgi:hypothetical protein